MAQDLKLIKSAYKLLHSEKFLKKLPLAEVADLEHSYLMLYQRLSTKDLIQYKMWKELEDKIIKNDFPELAQ